MIRVKNIINIIKLCLTPTSIFFPIPIFCFTLFFISNNIANISSKNIYLLFMGILFSLISCGASNFWNQTNDIKEDANNKKETILTIGILSHRSAIIISIFLYLVSFIIIFYLSLLLNRPIYMYFLLWIMITWLYSDNIFFIKLFRIRLKEHYIGELITYVIAYPAYTMSIWLIFSDSITKGIILSIIFLFFGMAVVLLKDLKDIDGDRKAGLKTFGVIFSPSKLIKYSCIFLIFYFIIIIIAIITNIIFNILTLIVIIPFFFFIKQTCIPFNRKKWVLEIEDSGPIKAMIFSTYLSLLILGFTNFI